MANQVAFRLRGHGPLLPLRDTAAVKFKLLSWSSTSSPSTSSTVQSSRNFYHQLHISAEGFFCCCCIRVYVSEELEVSQTEGRGLALPLKISSSHIKESGEEAEKKLSRESAITTIVTHTGSLEARLTMLNPVSRIPSETLSCIFRLLDAPQSLGLLCDSRKQLSQIERLGWLAVTQVCRCWRYIAFDNATLWQAVTFSLGSRWAESMLLHSKRVPISIEVSLESCRFVEEDAQHIARHLSHVEDLYLEVRDDSLATFLNAFVTSAPLLENLEVNNSCPSHTYQPDVICAPQDFFKAHAPRLRYVTLIDVIVPWTSASALFSNVHDLCILCFNWRPVAEQHWLPTLTQFLDVLENMVQLQSLVLRGCLPRANAHSTESSTRRKVSLPNLQATELTGEMVDLALVLNSLEIPTNAQLSFWPTTTGVNPREDTQQFFRALSNHISPPHRTLVPINNLHVSMDNETIYISCDVAVKQPRELSLEFEDVTLLRSVILQEFLQLPVGPIRVFDVTGFIMTKYEWQDALGQSNTRSIESIRIDTSSFRHLSYFLGSILTGLGTSQPTVPIPSLRSMEIFGQPMSKSAWTRFVDMLGTRKACGSPLRSLTLFRAPFNGRRLTSDMAWTDFVDTVVVRP